jgi:hypothetical protein
VVECLPKQAEGPEFKPPVLQKKKSVKICLPKKFMVILTIQIQHITYLSDKVQILGLLKDAYFSPKLGGVMGNPCILTILETAHPQVTRVY